MTITPGLVIGLILSAGIGLSLGLIGGGGSIITVPVLVYVIGVDPREAIPMSLAVVGATSLIGGLMHHRSGRVVWRTAATFGVAGIAGAFFGSRATYLISERALLLTFAALMFLVAGLMLMRRERTDEATDHEVVIWKALAAGVAVGALTGFLGVGGGFLIVPALILFAHLRVKEAIGTSLIVISINCAAGLAGHLRFGGFDVRLTLLVGSCAIAGAFGGSYLAGRTSPGRLRKGFALFVIAVALFLTVKNV